MFGTCGACHQAMLFLLDSATFATTTSTVMMGACYWPIGSVWYLPVVTEREREREGDYCLLPLASVYTLALN